MTRQRTNRTGLRSERGQAAVEFALVLPLLLVVLMGVVDFGFAFNYWTQETHVANLGARYAAVGRSPSSGDLRTYLKSEVSAALRDGGSRQIPNPLQVCISFPDGTSNVGDRVKVEVKSTYSYLPLQPLEDVGTGPLNASATMRLERVPDPAVVPAGCA